MSMLDSDPAKCTKCKWRGRVETLKSEEVAPGSHFGPQLLRCPDCGETLGQFTIMGKALVREAMVPELMAKD